MPLNYGLIEPIDLPLPHLPVSLEGLRIAHLSDLHVRRLDGFHQRLIGQLGRIRLDLLVLTGDYMDQPGDEPAAARFLTKLLDQVRPSLGAFGVFGNHDTAQLRDAVADLPVRWLCDERCWLPQKPIELMGLGMPGHLEPDSVALALHRDGEADADATEESERPLRLLLCHGPSSITTAADLGADLFLCGHTHGGQCRLPTGHALVNSTDLPLRLTSGLLRHRDTLAAISRGVGRAGVMPRLFCRPHVPLYTLHRRPCPGRFTQGIVNLRPW
ncbi:MAG TPA: metallophosphoesterase [Phycisphaeraceae bacterium]